VTSLKIGRGGDSRFFIQLTSSPAGFVSRSPYAGDQTDCAYPLFPVGYRWSTTSKVRGYQLDQLLTPLVNISTDSTGNLPGSEHRIYREFHLWRRFGPLPQWQVNGVLLVGQQPFISRTLANGDK